MDNPRQPQRTTVIRCDGSSRMGLHVTLDFVSRAATVVPYGLPGYGTAQFSLAWSDGYYLLERQHSEGTGRVAVDRITGEGLMMTLSRTGAQTGSTRLRCVPGGPTL